MCDWITFLLVVLSASPAAGQSLVELAKVEAARRQAVGHAPKVYTNADLKAVPGVPPPTVNPSAIYEHFLERQRANTPYYGPQDVVIGSPTAGPFGEFKPFDPPRRLDGTLLSDPPWYFSSYIGGPYGPYGGGYGSSLWRPAVWLLWRSAVWLPGAADHSGALAGTPSIDISGWPRDSPSTCQTSLIASGGNDQRLTTND